MESGEFSRGKESIRADGGIVMVGNFDVDVARPAAPRPPVRADAQGDARRHRVPRPHPRLPPGLGRPEARPVATSPTTSGSSATSSPSAGASSAATSRLDVTQGRLEWGSQLSGRDRKAANNTVNGLLKLLWPDPEMEVPDDALAWAAELALECAGG